MRGLNAETLGSIALTYGVGRSEFDKVYGEVWRLANAEMQTGIRQDDPSYGKEARMPIAKIWMGKSLGGMTDSWAVVSADAESDEDGSVSILKSRASDAEWRLPDHT